MPRSVSTLWSKKKRRFLSPYHFTNEISAARRWINIIRKGQSGPLRWCNVAPGPGDGWPSALRPYLHTVTSAVAAISGTWEVKAEGCKGGRPAWGFIIRAVYLCSCVCSCECVHVFVRLLRQMLRSPPSTRSNVSVCLSGRLIAGRNTLDVIKTN